MNLPAAALAEKMGWGAEKVPCAFGLPIRRV